MFKNVNQGDLYFIKNKPHSGNEMDEKLGRPAVIISRAEDNAVSGVVSFVFMSHQYRGDYTHQFQIKNGYCIDSYVRVGAPYTRDNSCLGDYIGHLTPNEMKELRECLSKAFGLEFSKEEADAELRDANSGLEKELAEALEKLKSPVANDAEECEKRFRLEDKCIKLEKEVEIYKDLLISAMKGKKE